MKISELPPAALAKCAHLAALLDGVELPEPTGWHVLVLQYIRPMKVGSIHLSDKTLSEDKWQGRVGLVLAVGPDAYKGEKFSDSPWCVPGDWVIWPAAEAAVSRFEYGQRSAAQRAVLTVIADDRVLATGVDPEVAVA